MPNGLDLRIDRPDLTAYFHGFPLSLLCVCPADPGRLLFCFLLYLHRVEKSSPEMRFFQERSARAKNRTRPSAASRQAVGKVQGLFRQPAKMPLLLHRCSAQKSSLRSLNALPSKAFRAFDPTRGGLPPPRAPPPILGRIRLNRGSSTSRAGPPMRSRSAFQDVITVYWAARKQSRLRRR